MITKQVVSFIRMVSELHYDGEDLNDGTEYEQSNDDARDTLITIIEQARNIVNEEPLWK